MKTTAKKQNIIGLKEFRLNAEKYITRIQKGESFTILKRSTPVFKITPLENTEAEIWETVVDFTEINPKGISAKELIKTIRSIHG
jgi:antitoxin (DNA-binding transcriptional repressor) of toxin-antitoxin stability system